MIGLATDPQLPPVIFIGIVVAGIIFILYQRYQVRLRKRKRKKPVTKLGRAVDQQLEWTQIAAGINEYELSAEGELVATLQFRRSWGIGQYIATGESADGC